MADHASTRPAWVARLAGVSHRYGATPALDAVDLEIPAGCLAGLIGPDGVGKSTVLGLIAGARATRAGVVEVLGGSMRSPRFRRAVSPRIAYMPQGLGRNLYPALSASTTWTSSAACSASPPRSDGRGSTSCSRRPSCSRSATGPPASCRAA